MVGLVANLWPAWVEHRDLVVFDVGDAGPVLPFRFADEGDPAAGEADDVFFTVTLTGPAQIVAGGPHQLPTWLATRP